jgi:hypothetical protein
MFDVFFFFFFRTFFVSFLENPRLPCCVVGRCDNFDKCVMTTRSSGCCVLNLMRSLSKLFARLVPPPIPAVTNTIFCTVHSGRLSLLCSMVLIKL